MAENRTLADFAREETERPSSTQEDAPETGTADAERPPASIDAESDPTAAGPETTYAWVPDGAACAACGERVERRYRDDGQLVCPSCKEW